MPPSTTSSVSDPSFLTNTSPGLERAWYAVATSDEITEQPRAVQLLGRHWCVLRLDGQLTAFEDRCPHRLAPLSIGTNCGAVLECRYHGWRFDRTGACTLIPSLGPDAAIPPRASVAVPYGVVERYGLVWLAPAAPVCELPAFDEWDDPTYDTCRNEPRDVACSAFQLTDNFLDATHLPTVHTQTFGVADAGYLPPHEVAADGWRISTLYRVTYRNHDDPLVATGEHPLAQPQDLYKEACPASTALIRLDMPLTGKRLAILFALQPQHDGSSRVYKQMARNDFAGDEQRIKESLAFEDLVMDEDLVVLEAYRELGVPLDVRTEVHTRTDKLSLAYRRLLAALVGGEETFSLTPRS
ncbi:MAG: Rieske 2Fe-2S domain-containing protein [Acidimicrobiia bacterium]